MARQTHEALAVKTDSDNHPLVRQPFAIRFDILPLDDILSRRPLPFDHPEWIFGSQVRPRQKNTLDTRLTPPTISPNLALNRTEQRADGRPRFRGTAFPSMLTVLLAVLSPRKVIALRMNIKNRSFEI